MRQHREDMHELFVNESLLLTHFKVVIATMASHVDKQIAVLLVLLYEPPLVEHKLPIAAHQDIADRCNG